MRLTSRGDNSRRWRLRTRKRDPTRKHPPAGMVHISTGMTTKDEVEKIVSFWEQGEGDAKNRVVLYNCTSGYPVPFEDVCLL